MTKAINKIIRTKFPRIRPIFQVVLLLIIILVYLLYHIGSQRERVCSLNENKNIGLDQESCFTSTPIDLCDDIILYDDIFEAVKKPTPDRTIFFIETSCVRNGLASLKPR